MYCNDCGTINPESSRFCASCGAKIGIGKINSVEKDSIAISNLTLIAETIHITLLGKDSNDLSLKICQTMGVKELYKVVFNVYASRDFFVVLPVSKDKGKLALFGMLFGAGVLGAVAIEASSQFSKKLEKDNSKIVLEKDNPLYSAMVIDSKTLSLKLKEKRSSSTDLFDIFKKETWMLTSGSFMFENKDYEASVKFGFEGQSSDFSKKRLDVLEKLISSLGIQEPPIHTGKNPPF